MYEDQRLRAGKPKTVPVYPTAELRAECSTHVITVDLLRVSQVFITHKLECADWSRLNTNRGL